MSCLLGLMLGVALEAGAAEPAVQHLSLRDSTEIALQRNRVLQIERLNPQIARAMLSTSYGYYDPILTSGFNLIDDADTGGFDPADFSRDAIYEADSEVASGGLAGVLPTGLSYNLTGGYAHSDGMRNFLQFDSYKLNSAISVRQPLLKNFWTDQGRMQIRVSRKLLEMSELYFQYVVMDTVNQVQQAYFELLFARENQNVRERLLAAKQSTLTGVRRQVEVGALTVLEEKLALSEVARVEAELVAVSNTVVLAENVLKTLLGYRFPEWHETTIMPVDRLFVFPQALDLAESWHSGFKRRPDLAQMKADVERAQIDLRFRRNQLFPALDLVASYGRRGASAVQATPTNVAPDASFSGAWEQVEDGVAATKMVGVVLTTPLAIARERASYRAGKELKEQAELRLRQKEEWVLREVSDAVHNARSAFARATTTKRARDYAAEALKAEEQKLTGGKSSLFFVLQLQSDLADTESAEVRARADFNKALSQLHFAEGTLLERTQITIHVE